MNVIIYGFWLIFGITLAYLFLITQRWSVRVINPRKPKLSKLLIVGGAILRWAFVFLALLWALSFSLPALFLVFTIFMISRMLILAKWQGLIFNKMESVQSQRLKE
jgi:fatty acid desaturase